jgi:hypothetical protein
LDRETREREQEKALSAPLVNLPHVRDMRVDRA